MRCDPNGHVPLFGEPVYTAPPHPKSINPCRGVDGVEGVEGSGNEDEMRSGD